MHYPSIDQRIAAANCRRSRPYHVDLLNPAEAVSFALPISTMTLTACTHPHHLNPRGVHDCTASTAIYGTKVPPGDTRVEHHGASSDTSQSERRENSQPRPVGVLWRVAASITTSSLADIGRSSHSQGVASARPPGTGPLHFSTPVPFLV